MPMSEILHFTDSKGLSLHFELTKIGVVTAIQEELDALIELADETEPIAGEYRAYHKLTFKREEGEFTVIAHTLNEMGITSMTVTLMEMITGFTSLEYIALIGIAAGSDRTEQKLGDILIPKKVYNYEAGKYKETDDCVIFQSDKLSHDVDTDLIQFLSMLGNDKNLLAQIKSNWTGEHRVDDLSAHPGNFACGSAVIASGKKIKELEKHISRKYIGIDMESFALVTVNQIKPTQKPKMFIIKSITDFADNLKDDSAHKYASYTAASFFIEVCAKILLKKINVSNNV